MYRRLQAGNTTINHSLLSTVITTIMAETVQVTLGAGGGTIGVMAPQ